MIVFRKIIVCLKLVGIILLTTKLYSATIDKINAGIFAGIYDNRHLAGFVSIPNYSNQFTPYNNASSIGTNFGITSEYYLFSSLGCGLNIAYNSFGATLGSDEYIGNQEVNGNIFPVYTHHSLATKLSAINFQFDIKIRPIVTLPVSFDFGFSYGLLTTRSFVQTESLSQEAINNGYRFIDKNGDPTTIRQKGSGKLPFTFDYRGLYLGIQYLYKFDNNFRVGIETKYLYNIQEIVKYTGWKVNQLGLNLSLLYNFQFDVIKKDTLNKYKFPDKIIDSTKDKILVKIDTSTVQENITKVENIVKTDIAGNKKYKDDSIRNEKEKENFIHRNQLNELSQWNCCYLIIFSSDNRKLSEEVLSLSKVAGINDVSIKIWHDSEDNTDYFRVQTDCIPTLEKILETKNQLKNSPDNLKNIITPTTKCE